MMTISHCNCSVKTKRSNVYLIFFFRIPPRMAASLGKERQEINMGALNQSSVQLLGCWKCFGATCWFYASSTGWWAESTFRWEATQRWIIQIYILVFHVVLCVLYIIYYIPPIQISDVWKLIHRWNCSSPRRFSAIKGIAYKIHNVVCTYQGKMQNGITPKYGNQSVGLPTSVFYNNIRLSPIGFIFTVYTVTHLCWVVH